MRWPPVRTLLADGCFVAGCDADACDRDAYSGDAACPLVLAGDAAHLFCSSECHAAWAVRRVSDLATRATPFAGYARSAARYLRRYEERRGREAA